MLRTGTLERLKDMRIGYTVNKESIQILQDVCQRVYYFDNRMTNSEDVIDFFNKHISEEIYVYKIKDLGLQLVQLLPCLNYLLEKKRTLNVLNKGVLVDLTNEQYCAELLVLAKNERTIMKNRTKNGLNSSIKKGIQLGRPRISLEKIQQIQFLHHTEFRTMREIAEICRVSLGTVHKYIKR